MLTYPSSLLGPIFGGSKKARFFKMYTGIPATYKGKNRPQFYIPEGMGRYSLQKESGGVVLYLSALFT